jgi:hypothetical protein
VTNQITIRLRLFAYQQLRECHHGLFALRRHCPVLSADSGAVSGLLGAIEGVRRGVFSPDVTRPPDNFAALKARIAETLAALEASEASEVDAFVGRDMRFTFGVGR